MAKSKQKPAEKPEPKANGRPLFVLSDADFEKIEGLAKIQCTQQEVCDVMEVTDKTLNKALAARGEGTFYELYKKNISYGKVSLRREQWKTSQKGHAGMQIFLGKNLLGQSDKIANEHSGPDGGAIEINNATTTRERFTSRITQLSDRGPTKPTDS